MATTLAELTKQSKTVTVEEMGGGNVQQFFESNLTAIKRALPRHMTADRLLKVAMHAIRTTPQLRKCNVASLMGAVVQSSQLGLEPNTVLGHAFLVPFYNSRAKRLEVQLIPGYKGLIDLARRSGQIKSLHAEAIYREEVDAGAVEIRRGTDGYIRHDTLFDFNPEQGEIVGFYAVAHFKDGGYQFEFMTRLQVDAIRNASQGYRDALKKGYNTHPWMQHYVQMSRKTLIRRLSNYLPLSVEFATATAMDGLADAGKSQELEAVLDGSGYQVAAPDAPAVPPEDTADDTPWEPPEDAPEAPSAAHYVKAMEAAETMDQVDEIMAEAADTLSGQHKANVTKAYTRNKDRLTAGQTDYL